jgi:isoleucyl-tRNA synthetase
VSNIAAVCVQTVPSWFVRVEAIKERLLANNAQTYWVPAYVKEKRFHNWLENAHDWAVSRTRFWGTPLPIWTSEDGKEVVVIGSVAELEELTGEKVRQGSSLGALIGTQCRKFCLGIPHLGCEPDADLLYAFTYLDR